MAVAQINGQSINYADTGGDGPAVLFSHGFLMDHSMFDAQVDALSDTYRCVAWDERGFGATPATEPFTYWDSADDAVALLDHLRIDQAVLVGMSQGGFLSLRAALAHPDRVKALVMIDSQAGTEDPAALEGYQAMMAHWMSDEPLGDVGEFVAGLILGSPELAAEWIPTWESRRDPSFQFPSDTLLSRDDITDRLGEIACPVLSIHGDADQAISMERAEAVQSGVADGRGLVVVPGAAHAPNMSHVDIVNPALVEFLGTVC